MGFVPSSSTIQLYAYFTEYARERIFNGDVPDFKVTQFTLHDEDVNYLITSNSDGSTNQPLTTGFIPDVTGDIDSCIKSNKSSVVFGKNMLTGTTQVSTPVVFGCTDITASNYNPSATVNDGSCQYAPEPIRTLTVGFQDVSFTEPGPADSKKSHNHDFYVFLKTLVGDTSGGPTDAESLATTFNIEILDYDPVLIELISITPANPINFPIGNNIRCTLNFRKSALSPSGDPNYSELATIKLKLVSLNPNRPIEPGRDIYTYSKNLLWL